MREPVVSSGVPFGGSGEIKHVTGIRSKIKEFLIFNDADSFELFKCNKFWQEQEDLNENVHVFSKFSTAKKNK